MRSAIITSEILKPHTVPAPGRDLAECTYWLEALTEEKTTPAFDILTAFVQLHRHAPHAVAWLSTTLLTLSSSIPLCCIFLRIYSHTTFIVTPNRIFILVLWKPKVMSENKIKFERVKHSGQPRPGMNVESLMEGQP